MIITRVSRFRSSAESLEDQLEWWKGFAYVLWLDLGYLLLLLLLLLSLALFVIKTPAVRDLSCIKPCADKTAEILSALWEGTVDNSKRARDKTAACWAALVAFLSGGCCEAVSGFFSKLCPKGAEAPYAKLEEVAVVAPASTASSPPVATPTAATETTAASSPGKVPAVVGKLTLHAKSGFDLMAMDAETATKKATSDPYLIVTMPGSAPKKSRVVEKTLHPVWDEKFEVGGRTLEELGALGAIKIQVSISSFSISPLYLIPLRSTLAPYSSPLPASPRVLAR